VLERQVSHLIRLVDDLLDVSRVNRGDIPLQKRPVPVADFVSSAVETSRPLVEARHHRLDVLLPEAPLCVHGDAVRLSQVVSNLVNNAASYTPDGGRIEVRVREDEGQAEILVADDGAGLEPAALQDLFVLFSRGEQAGRHPTGFGIGLALAKRLVEAHGGSIAAKSDGPGKGATFVVRLPLCAAQAAVPSRSPGNAGARGKRILIVDDNRDAADSLSLVLKMLGADVRIAHDGSAALAAFEADTPSVVLLDIGMPGMDGYEVAREIRARYPERRAALVALTGWGQEGDRRRAREAGFDHHLVKPAEIATLESLLASLQ
jgi:CheY-like chemotaxis protein